MLSNSRSVQKVITDGIDEIIGVSVTMDVLLLSGNLVGGAAKVCCQLAKGLPRDITPTVAHLGGQNHFVDELDDANIETVRLGWTELSIRSARELDSLLRTGSFDLLHTHMLTGGLLGRPLGAAHGIPIVHTAHTNFSDRSAAARYLDLLSATFVDRTICVSDAVAASLPRYYPTDIQTIHNCIDIHRHDSATTEPNKPLDGIDIDQTAPIIANISRNDPVKRRVDLLEAFPRVLADYPSARLVLTGRESETRANLTPHARRLGIQDSVHFVGYVSNIRRLNERANIMVFSSESEGFSISLLETMALGRPIVATEIAPFIEALGENYPSTVPVRSPERLGQEIVHVLSDSAYRERLRRYVLNRVERFASPNGAVSHARLYRQIVRSNS
jgi:glycosyltransferase involved in cell wall biosynthesis